MNDKQKQIIDWLNGDGEWSLGESDLDEQRLNFRYNLLILLKKYYQYSSQNNETKVKKLDANNKASKSHIFGERHFRISGYLTYKEQEEFFKKNILVHSSDNDEPSVEFLIDKTIADAILVQFKDKIPDKLNDVPKLQELEISSDITDIVSFYNDTSKVDHQIKIGDKFYNAKRILLIAYAHKNGITDTYISPYYTANYINKLKRLGFEFKESNSKDSSVVNYKSLYEKWMKDTSTSDNSNKLGSYINAIEILSTNFLDYDIFETTNLNELTELYNDLLQEQKIPNGKYYYKEATSYGTGGYYSASIKSYIDFLNTLNLTEKPKGGKNMPKQPLNQILYGPPGTGKTYNTINKALEIIFTSETDKDKKIFNKTISELEAILKQKNPNKEERKNLKNAFEYYKDKDRGQIEFITFHQSYAYEEFIEGIKPNAGNCKDDNKEISYCIKDGVFKKLSNKAKENFEKSSILTEAEIEIEQEFNNKLEKFKEVIEDKIDENSKYLINDTTYIVQIEEDAFRYTGENWGNTQRMKYSDLFQMYKNNVKSRKEVKSLNNISGLAKQHASYFIKLFEKFNEIKVESHKSTQKESLKNYILIVDEINRGNISKIFGELITLIEDSKRIGSGKEDMTATLPYSGEKFGAPNNLYIIGTMNTADRSIAHIDTALRRRFEFVEMMPKTKDEDSELDFNVDGVDGINIKNLLKSMNDRIEVLYDREHTIGHAYFMSLSENSTVDDLAHIFENKIIPLLAEYFYNDSSRIQLVFNNNGFIKDKDIPKSLKSENTKKSYYIVSEQLHDIAKYKDILEEAE